MNAVTAAYVLLPDLNVAIPAAPSRFRLVVSPILLAAVMLEGLVIFSIWTPLSVNAATAAYVLLPDLNVGDTIRTFKMQACCITYIACSCDVGGVGNI